MPRQQQAAYVSSCHSQWWCTGRGRGHIEQVACDTGNVLILRSIVGLMQSDIHHCHHGGISKKTTTTDRVAKSWHHNNTNDNNKYFTQTQ